MGNEVSATLQADSSQYENSFRRLDEAHNKFEQGGIRVNKAAFHVAESFLQAGSVAEAFEGSMFKLIRVLGLTGSAFAIFGLGAAAVGAVKEGMKALTDELDKYQDKIKASSSLPVTGDPAKLEEGVKAAKDALNAISERRQELGKLWNKENIIASLAGPIGGAGLSKLHALEKSTLAGEAVTQNKVILELGQKELEQKEKQNDLLRFKLAYDDRGAKLAEVELNYVKAITEAKAKGQVELEAGIENERSLQLALAEQELDKQQVARDNSRQTLIDSEQVADLRARGLDTEAKKLELVLGYRRKVAALEVGHSQGIANILANELADQQTLANREEGATISKLAMELQLASNRDQAAARGREADNIKRANLESQLSIEKDVVKQLQLGLQIAQLDQQMADKKWQTERSIAEARHESYTLDLDFANRQQTAEVKKTAERREQLRFLKETFDANDGDPLKQEKTINDLRKLRNEVAAPINRTDFSVSSKQAIGGGGRIGSGGDPLLAATKDQTATLKAINATLARMEAKNNSDLAQLTLH